VSLMTTWTTSRVPPLASLAEQRERPGRLRPAWDCANCSLLNPGARRRCTDCGTTRDEARRPAPRARD
jgi:hypothetical protein